MEIYLITNKLNDKRYVGLTTRTSEERFKEHIFGTQFIDREIQKYGIDNFTLEVLCRPKTIKELQEKEKYWADKLNTYYPNGYNIAQCGAGNACGISKEVSYVLAAKKSFEEFIELCFKKQYGLTSHSAPIKIWLPSFNSVFDDMKYYPVYGEEKIYRSVNKAVKDIFNSEYGIFSVSRDMILKSINEKIPVEAKIYDGYTKCAIKCDKNGFPINSVWYCASHITKDEYNEYISQNKSKIIDENIESYSYLYDVYKNKTDREVMDYLNTKKVLNRKNLKERIKK